MPGRVNGFSLAYTATGAVVLWSGIKGWSISETFRNLLAGKTPAGSTEPIDTTSASSALQADLNSGTSIPGVTVGIPPGVSASGSSATGMAALKQAAHAYGWDTGAEWTALNYVEMREAGYNPHAKNPSSGAYGMAQSLGHPGTPGTEAAEYGGYGLTSDEQRQANSGNAYWQSVWMCAYIKNTYGDPVAAADHERKNNWY